jgi:phenylacetate-CoA ligase
MATWRTALATYVLDPVGWKIKGTDIGGRLEEFRRFQWDDPEAWRARQRKLLNRILAHAVTRVPFYRDRVIGLTPELIEADPFESLKRFPVLEREDLLDSFDDLTCDMGRGATLGRSGGSTGTPIRYLHDREYTAAAFGTTQLSFDWSGLQRGDRRIALWGARRDFVGKTSLVRRLNFFLRDITILDAFRMGEAEMREYVRFINGHPPVALEGYTEAVFALAEFIERSGLDVASPRTLVVGAGTLLPHMRETLGRVFRAPVFDHYGTREGGLIATECEEHTGLHEMVETTVVEIIDGDGREVGEGEAGEVVTTNLWNYTMPLIRYRVGDHVVRGTGRCRCGRTYPLIDHVVGRSASAFARSDGGLVLPDFWIRVFAVDFNTGDVQKYQFVQEEVDRITVRLVMRPGHAPPDAKMRKAVEARINDAMGAPTHLEFSIEDDIPPTASGKHLYSVSRLG